MNEHVPPGAGGGRPDVLRRIIEVVDQFERNWRAGTPMDIREVLGRSPESMRPELAYELIALEVELRSACGEKPAAEAYVARFPDHSAAVAAVFSGDDRPETPASRGDAGGPRTGRRGAARDESVLEMLSASIGRMPHVLLRDPSDGADPGPLVRPSPPDVPGLDERPDRLQLFGEIARGGMGAILKGRDPDLGREVAVKVLLDEHSHNPVLVRRFVEEAQIGGQLQHPGIVPVYRLGVLSGKRPFFSMKLVKGRTLAKLLAERQGRADGLGRLLDIFEAVCQTMAYAHARGVIHRDLKPSNVMVGSFGEVQVMDWGLAKVLPRGGAASSPADDVPAPPVSDTIIETLRSIDDIQASCAGSILGTPAYMAPEQARGEVEDLDARADVYSLGSILCEILTGTPALTGRASAEILRKAARGDLADALARLDALEVDAELIRLAKDCLAPEPHDRLHDAGEIARRLQDYRSGVQSRLKEAELAHAVEQARAEEEAARRQHADQLAREAMTRARAEARRRRATATMAASVVALVVLGAGGGFLEMRREQERVAQRQQDDLRRHREKVRAQELIDDARRYLDSRDSRHPSRLKLAGDLLSRAEELLLRSPDVELQSQLAIVQALQAREETRSIRLKSLLQKLDTVRARRGEDDDRSGATDAAYGETFKSFGVDPDAQDPALIAAEFGNLPESAEIAAALDDWAWARKTMNAEGASWKRLVDAARAIDPDEARSQLRARFGEWEAGEIDGLSARLNLDKGEAIATNLLFARAMKQVGNLAGAAELLRAAREMRPADFWINYEIATASRGGNEIYWRPEEALQHFSIAAAIRPDSIAARVGLTYVFRSMARRDPERRDAYLARAIQEVELIRRSSADEAYCVDLLREIEEDRRDYKASAALTRAALRRNPDSVPLLLRLAQDLEMSGSKDEAIECLRQAIPKLTDRISRRPGAADLHVEMGLVWLFMWRLREEDLEAYDSGIRSLRKAIELQPQAVHPYNLLGDALRDKGDHAGSIGLFRQMVERMSGEPWAHYRLGLCYQAGGDPEKASESFRRAIALGSNDIGLHRTIADFFRLRGDLDTAIAEYRTLVRLDPYNPVFGFGLGELLYKDQRVRGAEGALRRVISLEPVPPGTHHLLGLALFAQSKYEEAAAGFRQEIAITPAHAEFHRDLGHALQATGRFAEALDAFTKAAELGPKDPEASSRYTSAIDRCRRFIDLKANRWPALLRGELKIKDAAEGIELAELAYYNRRYALAMRLYMNAFESDPGRARDAKQADRYDAACAAALAGCGLGEDDPLPDDRSKADLRKQARAWLRADLVTWSERLEADPTNHRLEAKHSLRHWKDDRDLAGIRDEAAMAKLSHDERAACRALWAEVDQLIARAAAPPKQ